MAISSHQVVLGSPAPEFRLPGTDGRIHAFADVAGERGTVIVFICNHCPYVKAVIGRMVRDARALREDGIGFAAICANDAAAYPEDSFESMQAFAKEHALPFPYLHDEDQSVAHAYGAVCTPDFFGYDAEGRLRYHGRLDEGRTGVPSPRPGASCSRPCAPSRRRVRRRRRKSRPWAARSSGSRSTRREPARDGSPSAERQARCGPPAAPSRPAQERLEGLGGCRDARRAGSAPTGGACPDRGGIHD